MSDSISYDHRVEFKNAEHAALILKYLPDTRPPEDELQGEELKLFMACEFFEDVSVTKGERDTIVDVSYWDHGEGTDTDVAGVLFSTFPVIRRVSIESMPDAPNEVIVGVNGKLAYMHQAEDEKHSYPEIDQRIDALYECEDEDDEHDKEYDELIGFLLGHFFDHKS